MGSEAFSRALMAAGEGFGRMAEVAFTNERDQANHLREQSLLRLRGEQQKGLQDAAFENRESLTKLEIEGRESIAAAEGTQRRQLMEEDWKYRATEAEKDRKLRREDSERQFTYQEQRLNEQRRADVAAGYEAQLKSLDTQIAEYNQMLKKAELENIAGVNEQAKAEVTTQLEQMSAQRRNVDLQRIIHLKNLSDPRYEKMDEAGMMREAGYTPQQIKAVIEDMKNNGEPETPPPTAEPQSAAPPPVTAPSAAAAPEPKQLMPEDIGNPLFAVEPGTGGRQLMDLLRNKPWIRNSRERYGLPAEDVTVASR